MTRDLEQDLQNLYAAHQPTAGEIDAFVSRTLHAVVQEPRPVETPPPWRLLWGMATAGVTAALMLGFVTATPLSLETYEEEDLDTLAFASAWLDTSLPGSISADSQENSGENL